MIFRDYSFVSFVREKFGAIKHLKSLFNRIQVEIGYPIVRIRSDRGKKFDNVDVDLFCDSKGIKHEFSHPRTTQQNGVTERKNNVIRDG